MLSRQGITKSLTLIAVKIKDLAEMISSVIVEMHYI